LTTALYLRREANGNIVQTGAEFAGRQEEKRAGKPIDFNGLFRGSASVASQAGAVQNRREPLLRDRFDRGAAQRGRSKAGNAYDRRLNDPAASLPGDDKGENVVDDLARRSYFVNANVLKASEDKTFPGAIVAKHDVNRWGQAISRPATRRTRTSARNRECPSARDLLRDLDGG